MKVGDHVTHPAMPKVRLVVASQIKIEGATGYIRCEFKDALDQVVSIWFTATSLALR